MNPFDQAPATPPVSFDPPNPLIQPAPRRGRMVLAAVAAAGLMGVGLVGVSQFASADRPDVDPNSSGVALATPEPQDDSDDAENDAGDDAPEVDGQIVIDTGDGEPIVIDLEGGTVDGQSFEQIAECIGLPAFGEGRMFDFEPGELESMFEQFEGMFEEFGGFGEFEQFGEPGVVGQFGAGGTHVTVMGPDGLQVIDLGEGDGSVTITQQDGELTIVTDGDATVNEIEDLLGAIEFPDLESLDLGEFDFGEFDFEQMFEDFPLDRFERMLPDDFEGFDFELPTDIQDCLAAAGNG
jgi:hypothetical protein